MPEIKEFIIVANEMAAFFDDFTLLEKRKLEAVTKNDIKELEKCMKKEQADIMILRGLERKKDEIQKQLGFEGLSFTEIIKKSPQEEMQEIKNSYELLSSSLEIFKNTSESVKKAIELNLYSINNILEQIKQVENENKGREAKQNEIKDTKKSNQGFTSKRV